MTTDTTADPVADGNPTTHTAQTQYSALSATLCDGAVAGETLSDTKLEVPGYFQWKAGLVRVMGAVLLVLASPAIAILALLVRCTSPGPAFYRQSRVGKNGRQFFIYKLRTMHDCAEAVTGPIWCQPGDSRITLVGCVLRFFHWDELPQLLNVVRGEMDLVGPRPERPELIKVIVNSVPDYCVRLQVLPGITGLAQINLPPDTDMDSARAKLALDLEYIRSATAGLDARIMLCTALRMIGIHSGHAARWMRLERSVTKGPPDSADFKRAKVDPPTNGRSQKRSRGSDTEVGQGTSKALSSNEANGVPDNGQAVDDELHKRTPGDGAAARFRRYPR